MVQLPTGFKFKRKLGSGCWGTSYLVKKDGQKLCLKSERRGEARAQKELDVINALHPENHVKTLSNVGNIHYIPMPYFPGTTLQTAIKHGLSLIERVNITQKVKDEVDKLFAKGYLHRDLHLGNIIYDDKTGEVNLIDFGRTIKLSESDKYINQSSLHLFFQPQTAPEYRHRGDIWKHSDIYSFGYMLRRLFPEASEQIKKLCDGNYFYKRNDAFRTIKEDLVNVFNKKRDELVASIDKLGDKYQQLRNALNEVDISDVDSITRLRDECGRSFDDFNSVAVHTILLKICELLSDFYLFPKETVLKFKMRAFISPEVKAPESMQFDLMSALC